MSKPIYRIQESHDLGANWQTCPIGVNITDDEVSFSFPSESAPPRVRFTNFLGKTVPVPPTIQTANPVPENTVSDTQVVDEELERLLEEYVGQDISDLQDLTMADEYTDEEGWLEWKSERVIEAKARLKQLLGQQLVKELESLLKTRNYADVSYFTGTEYSVICERIEQITAQYNLNPKERSE